MHINDLPMNEQNLHFNILTFDFPSDNLTFYFSTEDIKQLIEIQFLLLYIGKQYYIYSKNEPIESYEIYGNFKLIVVSQANIAAQNAIKELYSQNHIQSHLLQYMPWEHQQSASAFYFSLQFQKPSHS